MLLHVLALAVLAPGYLSTTEPITAGPTDPPVRLWVSGNQRFEKGDKVRVQVDVRDDGYLVVLKVDEDGYVRVLFPIGPEDDNFVRGGRRFEVRSADGGASFRAEAEGEGMVLAALSPDPYRFSGYATRDGWDGGGLRIPEDSVDLEEGATALLLRMTSERGFDYDALRYQVAGDPDYIVERRYYDGGYYAPYRCSFYSPYGFCDTYYGYGYGYGPFCHYCGSGLFVGISFGDPYYYHDPYYFGPYYWPYGYGVGGHRFRGGFGGRSRFTVLTGRPRGYDVHRFGDGRPRSSGSTFSGGSGFGDTRGSTVGEPRGRTFGSSRDGDRGARRTGTTGEARGVGQGGGEPDRFTPRGSTPGQDDRNRRARPRAPDGTRTTTVSNPEAVRQRDEGAVERARARRPLTTSPVRFADGSRPEGASRFQGSQDPKKKEDPARARRATPKDERPFLERRRDRREPESARPADRPAVRGASGGEDRRTRPEAAPRGRQSPPAASKGGSAPRATPSKGSSGGKGNSGSKGSGSSRGGRPRGH